MMKPIAGRINEVVIMLRGFHEALQVAVPPDATADTLWITAQFDSRLPIASGTFTFQMPDGTYQPFFYYGKGWNPEKVMKQTATETIKGGFISNESFGKDEPQTLNNAILEYQLILQQNGNFSTRPSSAWEAL